MDGIGMRRLLEGRQDRFLRSRPAVDLTDQLIGWAVVLLSGLGAGWILSQLVISTWEGR